MFYFILLYLLGWKNFETMERHIRLSGIEINDLTDGLHYGEEETNSYDLKEITAKEANSDFNGVLCDFCTIS